MSSVTSSHDQRAHIPRPLLASGTSVSQRTEQTPDDLTPRELQVAELAAANVSNQ